MVEELLDKAFDTEKKWFVYLVKWEGFPLSENTWEPESTLLEDVPEMVVDFNDRMESLMDNPEKKQCPSADN